MVSGVLTTLGIVTWTAFCQDLAQELVKEIIIKAGFGSLSLLHRDALAKAMKKIIKELLELLEYELGLDEDTEREELIQMQRAVSAFLKQQEMRETIAALLQGEQLDPAVLAQAWQKVQDAPPLPQDFSWQRISKRFSRKAGKIRDSIPELKAVFAQNAAVKADEALASSIGPQPDFDLDRYREALQERFGRLNLDCLDTDGASYNAVRLWSVFVPQSVRECEKFQPRHLELPKGDEERQEQLRPYFEQPPRPVLEVCADPQLQRIVILGDPGSGKSSLLRFRALEWARDNDPNYRALAPVPLLIELRDYHSKRRQGECSDSFLSYLHKAYSLHRFNQNSLGILLQTKGRVLLLLDGLDEIFDRQEREQVISDICRFSNQYKEARIILTSRVVGYEAHRLRDAEFRDFMLQDFDEEQIAQFLGRWHEVIFAENRAEGNRKQERLVKAIKDSESIKLLARNPLLLTMMAIINRHEELPKNRFELYEKAAKLLLQQWDTERHLQGFPGLKTKIDSWAKSEILRKVAMEMQTGGNKAANLIQKEKLIGLIAEYLETTFGKELLQDHPRNAAEILVEQLRERNFILCFLGGDSYGFVHRTFLEYFCATEFVHQFEKTKTLSLDGLLALYDQHCREDDWQEVLRLICGQLDESFAGRIIEHLTMLVDLEAWDKKTPQPELLLAVWCLSEVNKINRIGEKIGAALLLRVIECLISGERGNYIFDIFKSAEDIGMKWPGKHHFDFSGQFPEKNKGAMYLWPRFLANIFNQRLWIEKLTYSEIYQLRAGSLTALAEYWPDEKTRELAYVRYTQRYGSNEFSEIQDIRLCILRIFANHFFGDRTRDFLIQRVTKQDEYEFVRVNALEILVSLWPKKETVIIIKELSPIHGIAASFYGKEHSSFGKLVFQKTPGVGISHIDPRLPIPTKNIQKAAERASIPPDKIDEAVRSLSAHMGWDITKGSLAGKL